ncbi:helix-turn-helix domain-containing protein [Allopusillimonas ginsengisoli]|uniref:helix-turn-helix domain-containing protein n=1 Tax=Allopusillimonas ginsengisoli TaxID=453575 RepID=UPI0010210B46|nr:transcriptional regulator [Allopusillimonas ginsengisoli]TEA78087.1 transcriptional regulator [Allopusillimonas ginsengisoli]
MKLNDIRASWAALQDVTGIGPIQNETDYDRMVALADGLVDSGLAGEGEELSGLFGLISGLIADYDDKNHALPVASPREMLRFFMEQHGLTQTDLPEIGSQGVVSEILSGRRMLNARQIAALVGRFHVSADLFIEPVSPVH